MSVHHAERGHLGDWIAVRAHAERIPPRLEITFTLGDLPEGWARPRRHAGAWPAVLGLVLVAPFVAAVTAGMLRAAGSADPYVWLSSSPAATAAATLSLLAGIPVAIAVNLWRVAHVGLRRDTGAVEGLVALELAPFHLVVLAVALLLAGAFVAHLAADSYACLNGVRSAC